MTGCWLTQIWLLAFVRWICVRRGEHSACAYNRLLEAMRPVGSYFQCFVHTADRCVNEWRFGCYKATILVCFMCLLANKDAISVFSDSQVSAEALVMWGGKNDMFRMPTFWVTIAPEIIKVGQCLLKLQLECRVFFFETHRIKLSTNARLLLAVAMTWMTTNSREEDTYSGWSNSSAVLVCRSSSESDLAATSRSADAHLLVTWPTPSSSSVNDAPNDDIDLLDRAAPPYTPHQHINSSKL